MQKRIALNVMSRKDIERINHAKPVQIRAIATYIRSK